MTLLLPGVTVGEISAGADSDFQSGRVGVESQSQLQLSCYADALEEPAVGADAAAAALKGRTVKLDYLKRADGHYRINNNRSTE